MFRSRYRFLGAFLIACTTLSLAAAAWADRKDELKAAFAARRPALESAKSAGKIGETFLGYVDAVQKDALSDPQLKELVDKENADRAEAYHRIAERTNATEGDVAARGAAKHFQMARSGDYLKHADGEWRKKA